MNPRTQMINRWLVAAPWVTILALLGLSAALPNRTAASERTDARKAQIAAAVQDVPLFIGRWVGLDIREDEGAIPRAAQKLLKPNAILRRHYTSPGSPGLTVLFVHCGDARDMIGHYPPVCYPSAGWEPAADVNHDLTLSVQGQPFPVREYAFTGYLEGGREERIRIFSAFILPDGRVTREIDDINRQSERLSVSVQGVAQLQLITSGRTSPEDAAAAAEEILSGLSGLFDALGAAPAAQRGASS